MKDVIYQAKGNFAISNNPFDGTIGVFDWPSWVGYTFGSIMIVIGLCVFFLYQPRVRKSIKLYKQSQLDEYNKLYNRRETDYAKTGMYLPMSKKAISWAPLCIGTALAFVGVAWIVGNTLTTL